MRAHLLSHLSNAVLLGNLTDLVRRDCRLIAAVVAPIAEADARRLYLPAGYPSMHAYGVEELRLADDATNSCPPRHISARS